MNNLRLVYDPKTQDKLSGIEFKNRIEINTGKIPTPVRRHLCGEHVQVSSLFIVSIRRFF